MTSHRDLKPRELPVKFRTLEAERIVLAHNPVEICKQPPQRLGTAPSTSGRDTCDGERDVWLRDTARKLEASTLHIRICLGNAWLDFPLRLPQRTAYTPPPTPRKVLLADHSNTWEGALLHQLLAEPETQECLQRARKSLDITTVLRWSRAKHGDAEEAEQALRAHITWRADFAPGGFIPEASVATELAAQKVFLQGCDTLGRAVVVVLAARHNMRTRCYEETLRLIVYTLDAAVLATDPILNPHGQLLVLFDLSGLQMANLDVKILSSIFDLVQNHYPEHLAALWFLNAPFIFRTVWRGVQAFLQPSTREKIKFLSGGRGTAELQASVSLQVLPHRFGGEAELVPVDQALKLERRRSTLAASRRQKADKAAQNSVSSRLLGAGRAVKRWSGGSWAFMKRHNPAGALHLPKFSSATPRWPTMHRHISQVHRTISMRLPLRRSSTGGSMNGLKASGKMLAAIPELLTTLLRCISSSAAQALSWLGRRLTWNQPPAQEARKTVQIQATQLAESDSRHASSPCLVELEAADLGQQSLAGAREVRRPRRNSESDVKRRRLPEEVVGARQQAEFEEARQQLLNR